jgi:hypothetical protein
MIGKEQASPLIPCLVWTRNPLFFLPSPFLVVRRAEPFFFLFFLRIEHRPGTGMDKIY